MKKYLRWSLLLSVCVILFPLLLLVLDRRGGFSTDWYNSLWMISYQGLYFSQHGYFTSVFNTPISVGILFPVFYGYLLYPILGIVSSLFGPHLAIRAAAFFALSLQFVMVKRFALKATKDSTLAWVTAILVSWSIYPLTNLYSRSALPEFFSTTLLISAFCFWFLMLLEVSKSRKIQNAIGLAICSVLIAGTHPITAYYGLGILGLTILFTSVFHIKDNRERGKIIIILLFFVFLAFTLIMSPWLYVLYLFKDLISVRTVQNHLDFFGGIDEKWIRLFPLPLDFRSLVSGFDVPTPGLEAQINFSLLLLVLGSWAKVIKRVGWKVFLASRQGFGFVICLLFSYAVFNVSTGHGLSNEFGKFFMKAQFAYRLVTYSNLGLFICLFALYFFPHLKSRKIFPLQTNLYAVLITLSACGVLIKLFHASLILPEARKPGYSTFLDDKEQVARLPITFYGHGDYTIINDMKWLSPNELKQSLRVNIPVSGSDHLGDTSTADFDLNNGSWIVTNVYQFPWNRILLNGVVVERDKIAGSSQGQSFWIPSSGHYRIEYQFIPDRSWLALQSISFYTIILALLFCLINWIKTYRLEFES